MRLLKSGLFMRRLMLLIACLGILITVLDLLNILSGAAAKLTPLFLAFIVLFLLDDNRRLRRLRHELTTNTPTPNTLTAKPSKPNKKRQANPQPEYRSIAWHGLTLRSQSEVKIAKALDYKDVLFLADPKLRLNTESHRQTREVDFLIQYQGKWGILEVDGPHHQHSIEADQWRDARLTEHGLLVVRFPADQCYRQPDLVVETFLQKLANHATSAAS